MGFDSRSPVSISSNPLKLRLRCGMLCCGDRCEFSPVRWLVSLSGVSSVLREFPFSLIQPASNGKIGGLLVASFDDY
ncbi:hypothetical protein F2Q70_00012322 [Brassica cretica]|uniref:Uncharacterized protein n=1 Tax=Brassica cretica TaxID=69181 RepID=A0A8S9LY28_BRACR|nr:hypothetical protein F2Q70_00012322 [Brassica cretica]